jgi:hypothetical protein
MRFVDLPDTDWSYPYVAYLYCHSVISGYSDGTFRGGASANRGQLAKMLTLGLGWPLAQPETPTFDDVPVASPYYYYVETAYAHGVISGYRDHTFRPYNSITRAQLSKMIVIAKNWPLALPETPTFSDVPRDDWAFGFVETAHAQGVVAGYSGGTFRPGNEATRAQLSKMLSTAFQLPDGDTPTPTETPAALGTGTATPTILAGSGTPTQTVLPASGTPTQTALPGSGTPTAAVSSTATPSVTRTATSVPATSTTRPSPTVTTTAHP